MLTRYIPKTSLFASVLLLMGCGQAELNQTRAELVQAKAALQASQQELQETRVQLDALNTELDALHETPQGIFDRGVAASDAEAWEEAERLFLSLPERFPDAGLVAHAQERAEDALSHYIQSRVEAALTPLPETLIEATALRDEFAALVERCGQCESRAEAKQAHRRMNELLSEWPLDIESVEELRLRHADIQGKLVRLGPLTVQADTYFNYSFRDNQQWRSFKKRPGILFNLYCQKGRSDCEALHEAGVKGEPLQLQDVHVRYPNRYSDPSVIELVSFVVEAEGR
jgi:hypothetical protein